MRLYQDLADAELPASKEALLRAEEQPPRHREAVCADGWIFWMFWMFWMFWNVANH